MSLRAAIETLRTLNQRVPKPLRLPSEEEVNAIERRLGIQFSADYRYFLLHGSDIVYGTLEPAVAIPVSGRLDLVEMVREAWQMGVPTDYLPFCEDNGDYYCVTPDNRVVLWSHDGLFAESCADLAHWIEDVWIGG